MKVYEDEEDPIESLPMDLLTYIQDLCVRGRVHRNSVGRTTANHIEVQDISLPSVTDDKLWN
jgi:hypothetical protein